MSTVLELLGSCAIGAGLFLLAPWLCMVWAGVVLIACGYALSTRGSN